MATTEHQPRAAGAAGAEPFATLVRGEGPSPDGSVTSPISPRAVTAGPMQSKLSTVLATTYADSDFRDALGLLESRGVQNTAETRRQLRLLVQKDIIDSNAGVIREFGLVAEQLRKIGITLDRLNASYGEAKAKAVAARSTTSTTLDEAARLGGQRRQLDTKQALLKSFQRSFILTEDEISCLTSTSEPVDDRFFVALARAKKISKDCEILFGFEQQTLGREIMEQTARYLNLAFQKLYKWVRLEFRSSSLENPQIGSSIRRAVRVLAERPSLFESCLEAFAESRQNNLSDAFYTALTGNSPSGQPDRSAKPIELVAHDPLRYVGDMLAWTHSAAVSEKESLEIFFISEADEIAKGMQAGREVEFWRLADKEEDDNPLFDTTKAWKDLVDRDMAGVARLLRQRVEQVMHANEESTLAYKLSSLLNFYRVTFAKLLGADTVLVETLAGVESESLRLFKSLMRDHAAALGADFNQIPVGLAPPDFLLDALEQLTVIMRTYETSLGSVDDREEEFKGILEETLDPFLTGCENMAKTVEPPADSIFRLNYLAITKARLGPYDFTRRRAEDMQRTVSAERLRLIESQYRFLRTTSGADALMSTTDALSEGEIDLEMVRGVEALQPASLTRAAQELDDFLPSALMDALENIGDLQDAAMARDITEEAAERFCDDFERLEQTLIAVDDAISRQEDDDGSIREDSGQLLRTLFPRTSGEIRVLLS